MQQQELFNLTAYAPVFRDQFFDFEGKATPFLYALNTAGRHPLTIGRMAKEMLIKFPKQAMEVFYKTTT